MAMPARHGRRWHSSRVAMALLEQPYELADQRPLFSRLAAGQHLVDALLDVGPEDDIRDASDGGAYGAQLGHDLQQRTVLIEHALNPGHLASDSLQPSA